MRRAGSAASRHAYSAERLSSPSIDARGVAFECRFGVMLSQSLLQHWPTSRPHSTSYATGRALANIKHHTIDSDSVLTGIAYSGVSPLATSLSLARRDEAGVAVVDERVGR